MKALILDRYGRAPSIREIPEPTAGVGEVVVDVRAAGVNPVDLKIQRGEFRLLIPLRLPHVIGSEIAGVVTGIGDGATRFRIGDRVYGRVAPERMGAFAERCAVDERHLAPIPAPLGFAEAAGLPLVALTVHRALVDIAHVRPGHKVFVKAGSGGIGTFAIQYAKALGAEVATTTSTRNVDWVRALGADHVIDYTTQRFEDLLVDFDVVLDSVDRDGPYRGAAILKRGGHLVALAGPPDRAFAKAFGLGLPLQLACALLARKETRHARRAGVSYTFFFVAPSGDTLHALDHLFTRGTIRPIVDRVVPFDRAGDALGYLGDGRAKGKVVIAMA